MLGVLEDPLVREIEAEVTRRRLFGVGGGLAAGLLIGGCADEEAERAEPVPTSSPGSGRFPVKVPHRYGSTEVPAEPRRVVSVGLVEQDALLAFGVVPVATTEWFGEHPGALHPWARRALGDAAVPEVLTEADGIEFERIAGLRPDLIVAVYAGITEADFRRLNEIAPTIAQPLNAVDYGAAWQDLTRMVGSAIGRRTEADRLIADLEARFTEAAAAHAQFAGATLVKTGPLLEGNYAVNASSDPKSQMLRSLGFIVPPDIDSLAGSEYFAQVSQERIDILDADVLLWDLDSADQKAEIEADPLYRGLDVAEEGRSIFTVFGSDLYGAINFATVLSLPVVLDQLVPRLVAAVDGDPDTEVPA